jgi:hypothetical protein
MGIFQVVFTNGFGSRGMLLRCRRVEDRRNYLRRTR